MTIQVRPRIISYSLDDDNSEAECNHRTKQPPLRKLIRTILIGLTISGCYTYDSNYDRNRHVSRKCLSYRNVGNMYRLFCFLIPLAFFVKHTTAFFTLPPSLTYFNVVAFVWSVKILLFYVIAFKSGHSKYGHQRAAFDFWDETIRPGLDDLGIEFPSNKIRKRQTIYLFITASIMLINACGWALLCTDIVSSDFDVFTASPFSHW